MHDLNGNSAPGKNSDEPGDLQSPPPPATPLTAELQRRVYDILRLLLPHDMLGVGKRRIGGDGDGGYVLADILTPDQPILSLGVGPDVSFDLELAQLGHKIVMFDHTVDKLPDTHPNFTWHKLGIAAAASEDGQLRSLEELMALLPQTGGDPVLKIDVEGAEWESLAAASPATLRRFAQISIELHTMLALENPEFSNLVHRMLSRLAADFVPVHVHGNNYGITGIIGGFACPDTLELTYVRRDLITAIASTTWYPSEFDKPNNPERPDHLLWHFPFAPGSAAAVLA